MGLAKRFFLLGTLVFLVNSMFVIYQLKSLRIVHHVKLTNLDIDKMGNEKDILKTLKQELDQMNKNMSNNDHYQYVLNIIREMKKNNIIPNLYKNSKEKVTKVPDKRKKIHLKRHGVRLSMYKFLMPFGLSVKTRDDDIQRLQQVIEDYKRNHQPRQRPGPAAKLMMYGKK